MTFFCSHPFTSLFVSGNQVSPCCEFTTQKNETIDTYFSSEQIKKVKEQLLNNIAPAQCIKCVLKEEKTNHSLRIHKENFDSSEMEIREANSSDYFDIQDVNVITSNICNLLCLPCEYSSYVRQLEFKKIKISMPEPKVYIGDEKLSKILATIPNLMRLTLSGGEPFADQVAMEIIDNLIATGKSKNIRIDINTNLTLITKEVLIKLKTNFKNVFIKGSIDGIGEHNNYLRYPSSWQQIDNAVDLIIELDIQFIVTTAMSNLALLNYDQIIEWAYNRNLLDLVTSLVISPKVLSVDRLPASIKQKLLSKYLLMTETNSYPARTTEVLNACIAACLSPACSDEEFKETIIWLEKHDNHRGTNFRKTWPELNDY